MRPMSMLKAANAKERQVEIAIEKVSAIIEKHLSGKPVAERQALHEKAHKYLVARRKKVKKQMMVSKETTPNRNTRKALRKRKRTRTRKLTTNGGRRARR